MTLTKTNLEKRIMLSSKYLLMIVLTTLLFGLISNPAIARDLESIATNLTSQSNKLVLAIIPMGFILAAAFMAFGSPKGPQILSNTLMASVLGIGAVSIFGWFKGVVA